MEGKRIPQINTWASVHSHRLQTGILARLHPILLWPLGRVSRSFKSDVQRTCLIRFREACVQTRKPRDLRGFFYFLFRLHGLNYVARLLDELKPKFPSFADMIGTKPRLTGAQAATFVARSIYGNLPHAVKFLRRVIPENETADFDRVLLTDQERC
ncbi:hypothetical protein M427DRAFT_45260 [Gonapodya prolifera JEL478]|uniref:Uncharacterized protein n=1 Tax=Gonapodya prolifera (strain JEL478) TaxID=1344416 RepID=A0A139ABV3_GONPJ|nr:hypothetical protein M427DRAFT_45260 [Gonapodya prolifera JEL478]|eukprot:KXS14208.1 hypothetical protein M427DRAFT_45260 [Gonapodya prolifera JEL478]